MDSGGERDGGRAAGVWDRSHRRLTVGLLLVVSLTAFEALAVATVLPATATDLAGGDLGWYGWVFSGFMLANLVGIPAAGAFSDRFGATGPFLGGCALFAGGLVFSGASWSMPALIAGRVAQGLGAGALSSVAYVAVARGYDSRDQPRMLALLASAWVLPGLLGPSIAAAIATHFGWRAVFFSIVPLTLVGAVLATGGLASLAGSGDSPDDSSSGRTSSGRTSRRQIALAVRLALGCGLVLAAPSLSQPAAAAAAFIAGACVAGPALRRLVPAGTLSAAPGAPAALAAKALITFAFFGTEAFLPLALTIVRGESIALAGLVLTTGTMAWTTGAWIQERLVLRVSGIAIVRTGMILLSAAIVGAAGVLVSPWPVVLAGLSWATAGLGIGLCYSSATLMVFERTPKGEEGEAAAALQLANVLGVALGTGAGGAAVSVLMARGCSHTAAIAAADVLMLVAAIAGLFASARIGVADQSSSSSDSKPVTANQSFSSPGITNTTGATHGFGSST
ncbi:MAG TPA: MFS transporter [Candidatus Limnocylindrales bacterium]|nr:MFS transporter [Candidatus Limnocylindrales bacterium]